VALDARACAAVDTVELRRFLSIELGAQLLEEGAPPPTDLTGRGFVRAWVRCHGEAEQASRIVDLDVDDGVTGKALSRSVDLSQQDSAVHPRLIAVALAELVFASWAELLVTPQPAVQPATPPPSPATRLASSDRVARKLPAPLPATGVYLLGVGGVTMFFSGISALGGGGLRLGGDHAYHLGWDVEASASFGSASTDLGTVSADLVSGRAALLGHYRFPHLILRGGGGLRAGAARLAGSPEDPMAVAAGSIWGPWGGPLAFLSLAMAAGRLRVDVAAEGGYVLWPVAARVAGVRALAIEGPWLGLTVGIGALLR
jgi:hypothetical protein